MSADAVLDPAVVAELQLAGRECGGPTFVNELVELFRASAPARVTLIREAVGARDGATLGRTAHTLKSNAGMLGAAQMANICARLEAYGDAAAFGDAAALLDETDAELARVLEALAEMVSQA